MSENLIYRVEVITDGLTPEEENARLFLERKVERAFYEAGRALRELRDRRLYRSTHATFEEYVRDRFGMKQSRSYQLIDAAGVVDNLASEVPQFVELSKSPDGKVPQFVELFKSSDGEVPQFVDILPTNEAQCRPLRQLDPDRQREVWRQAVTESGAKVPSARVVKDIVQRIRERTRVAIPYRVGDVVEIAVRENPELRGLGGCWGIVREVREFSCLVRAWNGEYTVREENLKDSGYSPAQREEVRKLSDRLSRLASIEEEIARAVGAALGKLKRPYLTPLEESLLQVLEAERVSAVSSN